MNISSKVRLPANMSDSTKYTLWLRTRVGLQTVSWEWVYENGEIFVAFYRDRDADAFRKTFEL